MRIRIEANAILGVKNAVIEMADDQTALVVYGPNVCGKTSLAKAIGTVMSNFLQGNFHRLPASRKSLYCHNGDPKGEVKVAIDSGPPEDITHFYEARWHPMSGLTTSCGTPSLPVVVGMEDVLEWDLKAYTDLFRDSKIGPDKFSEAMAEALGYPRPEEMSVEHQDMTRELYKRVRQDGLPATIEANRIRGIQTKRDWEHAVASIGEHQKFGKKKAATWRPAGWVPEMDTLSVQDAERAVSAAQIEHAAVERQAHHDEAKVAHLVGVANRFDELTQKIAARDAELAEQKRLEHERAALRAKIGVELNEADRLRREANAKLDSDPQPDTKCPACGAPLRMTPGTRHLEVFVPANIDRVALKNEVDLLTARHKGVKERYEKASSDMDAARHKINRTHEDLTRLRMQESDARDAKKKLEGMLPVDKKVSPEEIEAAGKALEHARRQLDMVRAVRAAESARLAVARHEQIMDALKTGGPVANAVAAAGIGQIVKMVERGAEVLGIDKITFNEGVIEVGGRPAKLCSENEQFMARLAVQIAIAVTFRQPLVVVDRMDVAVSKERREALTRLITQWVSPDIKLLFFLATESAEEAASYGAPTLHLSGGTTLV